MRLTGNIWLQDDNGFVLGKGRVQLLERIQHSGSIMQAAKEVNISYRKAWEMIKQLNQGSVHPLVTSTTGGKYGGGAFLTSHGIALIQKYKKLHDGFSQFIHEENKMLNNPERWSK